MLGLSWAKNFTDRVAMSSFFFGSGKRRAVYFGLKFWVTAGRVKAQPIPSACLSLPKYVLVLWTTLVVFLLEISRIMFEKKVIEVKESLKVV